MNTEMVNLPKNIAIVHEWFLSKSIGGAENVVFLLDHFLSEKNNNPDIYSLVENISSSKNRLKNKKINTSLLQKIPFAKANIQKFLPFIPFAIEQLDLTKYDLILSSSHLSTKGIITSPDQLHICYVHTPMRYAWDQMNTYLEHSNLNKIFPEILIRYFLYKLRKWDYISSQRADYLIANSTFTQRRIKKYWGLNSHIIYPPVDIKRFRFNKNRSNFYLSVNRLVPNKRVDLIIKAFNKLGLPLIIIGDGEEKNNLKKLANKNIKFMNKQPDNVIEEMYSMCRGFVYAGIEDFGIAPVEAMASGAPVIALAKGGILDTVKCITNHSKDEVPTGLLFKNQSAEDIIDTISWFEDKKIWNKFDPEKSNTYSKKFDNNRFLSSYSNFICEKWENFSKGYKTL